MKYEIRKYATHASNRLWEKNSRSFLDNLESRFKIKYPSDWGKVKVRDIRLAGGNSLLKNYKGSLFRCLTSIYPEIEWKKEWFPSLPQNSWKGYAAKRNFLEAMKLNHNIKSAKDWGKLRFQDFKNAGGALLIRYYFKSIFQCLKSIYSETEWKKEWFIEPNFRSWKTISDRKSFLENMRAKFGIKKPSDWGKIRQRDFNKHGGKSLIDYYDGSVRKCVQALYPEMEWNRDWFPRVQKFPKSYWNSVSNCRDFLDQIAAQYHISRSSDWKIVTSSLIRRKGGAGLLSKYGNSVHIALSSTFPNWNFASIGEKNLWKQLLPIN